MDKQEINIRLFLKRLRARMRPLDPEERFPIEEGWKELQMRIDVEEEDKDGRESGSEAKGGALVFPMRYAYAAAVVLILLTGGIYWWLRAGREQGPAGSEVAHGQPGKSEKA